jgi:hypothetical protein
VVNVVFAIPYLVSVLEYAQQSIMKQVVRFIHVTAAQVNG